MSAMRALRTDVTIDEWIAAMESGKFRHGMGQLKGEGSFDGKYNHCCLGVLLEIAGAQWQGSRDYQPDQMACRQVQDAGSIPDYARVLLGPELEELLNRPILRDDGSEQINGHDLLVEVNDDSKEGYVPAIKTLRRLQEQVV